MAGYFLDTTIITEEYWNLQENVITQAYEQWILKQETFHFFFLFWNKRIWGAFKKYQDWLHNFLLY